MIIWTWEKLAQSILSVKGLLVLFSLKGTKLPATRPLDASPFAGCTLETIGI